MLNTENAQVILSITLPTLILIKHSFWFTKISLEQTCLEIGYQSNLFFRNFLALVLQPQNHFKDSIIRKALM